MTQIRGASLGAAFSQIKAGTITDTDINASAGISLSKLAEAVLQADGGQALTANWNAGAFNISSSATPTTANHLVNKTYADSIAAGFDPKESVRFATTADLPANTVSGSGVGKTITLTGVTTWSPDGTAVANTNRVLVKNYGGTSSSVHNGIYVVSGVGSEIVLTRATDFDGSPSNEVSGGAFCFAEAGTTYAGAAFSLVLDGNATIDTTSLQFTQVSGAGSFTWGDGLNNTGNNIFVDIVSTNPTLVFESGQLDVKYNTTSFQQGASGLELAATVAGDGIDLTTNVLAVDSTVVRTSGAQSIAGVKSFTALDTRLQGTGSILSLGDYGNDDIRFTHSADALTIAGVNDATITIKGDSHFWVGANGTFDVKTVDGSATLFGIVDDATDYIRSAFSFELKPLTSGTALDLRFFEDQANGNNYVGFKAPSTLSANTIWTLPSADGTNGQVLTTNGTGTLSWVTAAGDIESVTAGSGLTGGGSSGPVTLNIGAGAGIIVNADDITIDSAIVVTLTSIQSLSNKTLTTPTIADFTNATHDHTNAAGGGQLSITGATTGTLTETRGGTNQTTYTTGDLLYASAANTLSKRAIGTTGQILTVSAGVPTWTTNTAVTDARYVVRETPSGTINGSNTNFTLANTPQSGTEMLFLNGLLQNAGGGNDYVASGPIMVFSNAPQSGDVLLATYVID